MGKSLGNAYNLDDIEKKGFDPMDLRYFYLTAHYRKVLNFTWEALTAARTARQNLVNIISQIHTEGESKRTTLSNEKLEKVKQLQQKFTEALSNVKSNIPSEDKYDLVTSFDQVLGLQLSDVGDLSKKIVIPEEIKKLVEKRNQLRSEQKWDEADIVRKEIEEKGWLVEDGEEGSKLKKV
jgi:cysteinyl-tRNA synthetase